MFEKDLHLENVQCYTAYNIISWKITLVYKWVLFHAKKIIQEAKGIQVVIIGLNPECQTTTLASKTCITAYSHASTNINSITINKWVNTEHRWQIKRNTKFSKYWRSLENARISYCSTPNFFPCSLPSLVIDLIPTWTVQTAIRQFQASLSCQK